MLSAPAKPKMMSFVATTLVSGAQDVRGPHPFRCVGLLTSSAVKRRNIGGAVHSLYGISLTLLTLILAADPSTAETQQPQWHEIHDIASVAENFLGDRIGSANNRAIPRAGKLDPRLKLPRCTQDLEAFLQRGARITSRTVVGVRCTGQSPWKIYVPVDVTVTEPVLIAARTLPGGHVFTKEDFVVEERDVSREVRGYISRPADLVGKRLKHQLMTGRIIAPSMVLEEIMIKRGQTVTIMVKNAGLSISMMGKALMNGAENQRIRVENTISKRVVEGIVRSPEQVEVLVY